MKISIGAHAPVNDLQLVHLLKFREVNIQYAKVALTYLQSRHLYYLIEKNVVMSLFSNKIDEDKKSCIASKILTFTKPNNFKNSKPKQPVVVDITTTLESLVGAKSWTLFHVLGIKTDWLKKSPSV